MISLNSIPHVKICCIQNLQEAVLAINFGASALGFVSAMPSGFGPIPEKKIAEIVSHIPPPTSTFLLTSKTDVESIVKQQKRCKVNTIQLCDFVQPEVLLELKRELPPVKLVQVIHVTGNESIVQARQVSGLVDALLLDSGKPDAAVKILGGTGKTHDWKISKEIVKTIDCPVFLAGGLNAGNVNLAISTVRPFAVDVCTGVRTNGRLDEEKLTCLFSAIKKND